jgi:hypothetical protein
MLEDPKAAETLARAILDDITLDHDARVRASRDLTGDFAKEIEEGRVLFRSRVAPALHRVYEEELLPWQGRAKDQAVRLGSAPVDRSRLLLAVGAAIALVVVVVWLIVR